MNNVAASRLRDEDTWALNDETEIVSQWVGWRFSSSASAWVMKECCAPSSFPSAVVVADETAAMAVFNKHTLVYMAERAGSVIVVNEAVSVVATSLLVTCCSGGVTGTAGCVVSARKA